MTAAAAAGAKEPQDVTKPACEYATENDRACAEQPVDVSCAVFIAAAGYLDPPNFGPPPKIRRKNAAAEF